MPIFIVETTATSPIREYWKVEAATVEEAAETYGDKGEFLYDEVLGEEEDRQVSEVHPYDDADLIEAASDDVCADCGAPEGESHAPDCEARGFSAGAAIKRGEG